MLNTWFSFGEWFCLTCQPPAVRTLARGFAVGCMRGNGPLVDERSLALSALHSGHFDEIRAEGVEVGVDTVECFFLQVMGWKEGRSGGEVRKVQISKASRLAGVLNP